MILASFLIGRALLASLFGVWLPGRYLRGRWKHSVRCVVLTLLLGPVPIGPEGSWLPLFVPLCFFGDPAGVRDGFWADGVGMLPTSS